MARGSFMDKNSSAKLNYWEIYMAGRYPAMSVSVFICLAGKEFSRQNIDWDDKKLVASLYGSYKDTWNLFLDICEDLKVKHAQI
jgi:hypothetical protein